MAKQINYQTVQENFWSGEFGTEYIERNKGEKLIASNLNFFTKALIQAGNISSCIEFGANIGMNFQALKLLFPEIKLYGIEINEHAATVLNELIGKHNVYCGSILDWSSTDTFELVLIKGVLMHINPNELKNVYQKLYKASNSYILICEYYNPTPVTLSYRGHKDRLFKRDFPGEILDIYPDLSLVDYGFSYHRDKACSQDDINWFLLKHK